MRVIWVNLPKFKENVLTAYDNELRNMNQQEFSVNVISKLFFVHPLPKNTNQRGATKSTGVFFTQG